MRRAWPLLGLTILSAVAVAGSQDGDPPHAELRRARIVFAAKPDFEQGHVRANVDLRVRVPADELAQALDLGPQAVRVTLGEATVLEGFLTSVLESVGRFRLDGTRTRADGRDRVGIDLRRGRVDVKLTNADLGGMLDEPFSRPELRLHIGGCEWTEMGVYFDQRRPRVWTIRRTRVPGRTIRRETPRGMRRAATGYVLRTRTQLVELQRRLDVGGLREVRLRSAVDFSREMVVAVLPDDPYTNLSFKVRPAPGGLAVAVREERRACFVAFFQLNPTLVYRVAPRTDGPVAFRHVRYDNDCR